MADTNNTDTPLALTRGAVLLSRCESWGCVGITQLVAQLGPKVAIVKSGSPGSWGAKGSRMVRADVDAGSWIVTTEAKAAAFLAELQAAFVSHGSPRSTSWRDEDGFGAFQADAVSLLRTFAAA